MSESDTPSTTDENANRINLGEVVTRYLEGLQRVYDVVSYFLAGETLLNERDFENFARSGRVMPSQRSKMDFDAARNASSSWLLKQGLNETLGLLTLFLDDCRTIAGLAKWKASDQSNQKALEKVLNEERSNFLKLDLSGKIESLNETYVVSAKEAEEQVLSLYAARVCLSNANGVVTESELDGADALVVKLKNVKLHSAPSSEGQGGILVTSEMGDVEKSFQSGERISLGKNEQVAVILTVSFYVTSLAQSLREYATNLGVTEEAVAAAEAKAEKK